MGFFERKYDRQLYWTQQKCWEGIALERKGTKNGYSSNHGIHRGWPAEKVQPWGCEQNSAGVLWWDGHQVRTDERLHWGECAPDPSDGRIGWRGAEFRSAREPQLSGQKFQRSAGCAGYLSQNGEEYRLRLIHKTPTGFRWAFLYIKFIKNGWIKSHSYIIEPPF